MSGNKLPKNMGKKIADALKNQSLEGNEQESPAQDSVDDMTGISLEEFLGEEDNGMDYEIEETEIEIPEVPASEEVEDEIYDSSSFGLDMEDVKLDKISYSNAKPSTPLPDKDIIFKVPEQETEAAPELKLSIDLEEDEEAEEFEMPNNINVLRRLIAQLPAGVPKQTGAQIIRQTIEALGIPMKSVLQDAQKVRECLNSSIKDCAFTIQEYKSNIKNLEKQSVGYQKQLTKLNDIISLFIYNDKK